MSALWRIALLILQGERRAFAQGLALSGTVLAMGVALLALSGWFITAAAAAGMIGMGTVFNVFAPSSMVRFLALGRTAARYGERLTTHDATLRALSVLRVRLLGGVLRAPYRQVERLRANLFLNRVTADVDALDGLSLRLLLPGAAGLGVIALAALTVGLLVHPWIGALLALGYGVAPTLVFALGRTTANRPARRAESGMQALRSRLIDLVTAREELAAFGQLPATAAQVMRAADYQRAAQATLDQTERRTGAALDMLGWTVTGLALGLGAQLAQAGQIRPAEAAIGVFAALALAEAVAPVRRALSEIGRMRAAAMRVAPMLRAQDTRPVTPSTPHRTVFADGHLRVAGIGFRRGPAARALFAPLRFSVRPGETVALTGRSGCGKSTLLLAAAGQVVPDMGRVTLDGDDPHALAPDALAERMVMVPQRHALVAGTVAQNLRLALPGADDAALWSALEAAALADTLRRRGGLSTPLGFRGAGLSGGEGRRLALARAVLRRPRLLLLDEPTEGLDGPLAARVLTGIRNALPDTAILMAAHRPEEVAFADRIVAVGAMPEAHTGSRDI